MSPRFAIKLDLYWARFCCVSSQTFFSAGAPVVSLLAPRNLVVSLVIQPSNVMRTCWGKPAAAQLWVSFPYTKSCEPGSLSFVTIAARARVEFIAPKCRVRYCTTVTWSCSYRALITRHV